MEDYEIERRFDNVKKEIDDAAYDLRRAIEDLEGKLQRKADKAHSHADYE